MEERANRELQPAPRDYVEHVAKILPIGELPPERYVALNAHKWYSATIFTHSYPDLEVDRYVRRVEELLFDWENHDVLRHQWLSPEEYEQVLVEMA